MFLKHLKLLSLSVLAAWCLAAVASANVPPPPPEPPPQPPKKESAKQPLVVRVSNDGNYRLVIPRQVLRSLGIAQLDSQTPTPHSHTRSLLAALALSAGMISLVFVRNRSAATKLLTVVAFASVTYFASQAYADLLPFGARPRPPRPQPPVQSQTIQIEVSRRGTAVQLFVPAAAPVNQGGAKGAIGTEPLGAEKRNSGFGAGVSKENASGYGSRPSVGSQPPR